MDREVRRLVIVGMGLLVALFTTRTVIGAVWDDRAMIRQVEGFERKLRGTGEAATEPASSDLAASRRLRGQLQGRIELEIPEVQYRLPPEFDVGAGASPDLRYIEVLRREQEQLVREARFVGRSVPGNLGMPELNPTGLEDVLRHLRSLHVVHRVVESALAAGVDAVDEIKLPPVRRRGRTEGGFLRRHSVDFTLRGPAAAIRDALAGVVEGTPYLALDDVRIERVDEDGDRVTARFTAVGLIVDPEQDVLEEAADR